MVDVDDVVGDLGDAVARVLGHAGEEFEQELRAFVVAEMHDLQLLIEGARIAHGARASEARFHRRAIVHRFGVYAKNDALAFFVAFFGGLIETGTRLVAQQAFLDHRVEPGGAAHDVAPLVVRTAVIHIAHHLLQRIQADQVRCTECGRTGMADGGTGQRVHFLDAESRFHHLMHHILHGEGDDAVGHKVGRVLRVHNALAQYVLAKFRDGFHHFRFGVGRGNQLEQLQIARRIEKVRAQEVGRHLFVHTFGHGRNQDAARVRADDTAGLAMLRNVGKNLFLDVKPFDNDFDDPIAIRDFRHIVLEIADLDHVQVRLDVQGGWFGLEQRRLGCRRNAVSLFLVAFVGFRQVRGYNIQHDAGDTAVGQVPGNSRAHDARTQYCDTFNFPHRIVSPF